MGESFWTTPHIEVILAVIAAIIPVWLDLRNQTRQNREAVSKNYVEIEKRFTKIETMIQPLWDWFTNGRK